MDELRYIGNHIPPDLVAANPDLQKLVQVIDGITQARLNELLNYTNSYDPQLVTQIQDLRSFIDEFHGEYLLTTTKAQLECRYFNKYSIFSRKGTDAGLIMLIKCLSSASMVTLSYTLGLPLITFFTIDSGILPSPQDIANEVNFQAPLTSPVWVATLLGGSWSDYYDTITINITGSSDTSAAFTQLLETLIPLYAWFFDAGACTITINYI
jgi:hypothetical protein